MVTYAADMTCVVMFGPDWLKSDLHCWYITADRKLIRALICPLVFIKDNIQSVKFINVFFSKRDRKKKIR